MPLSRDLNVASMSFNAIRKIKILAKIAEFTVVVWHSIILQMSGCGIL